MTQTIWKYVLKLPKGQALEIPSPWEVLSVQFQGDDLCLWVRVTPGGVAYSCAVRIFGTGMPFDPGCLPFIGTAQAPVGEAWHVFMPRAG